jgi:F0F1-type ATP synthase assembly protein I
MIKSLLGDDEPDPVRVETDPTPLDPAGSGFLNLFDTKDASEPGRRDDVVEAPFEQESVAENFRRTGLAWSAGVAFTAAVIFMLILGWGADVLLGSSPWGIVGGIVLGSIIGFVQFFRTTSQIFKK